MRELSAIRPTPAIHMPYAFANAMVVKRGGELDCGRMSANTDKALFLLDFAFLLGVLAMRSL